jgi:Low psii accumulation1 / Rep27
MKFLGVILVVLLSTTFAFVQHDRNPSIVSRTNSVILWDEPSPSSSTTDGSFSKATSPQQRKTEFDDLNEEYLSQPTFGGYTVKQRLREEVESPFRKVRLLFFGSSAGSALTALYFSALNTIKALSGGYADAPPLDEALTSDAINIGGAVVCGLLAYREYKAGQSNLERIARGGKLASLVVEPAVGGSKRQQLTGYRRAYRVLIAAGGKDYISKLARSMTSDLLKDTNNIPEKLLEVDVIVVPVLLEAIDDGKVVARDTRTFWKEEIQPDPEVDRNFDISRADPVIAFPIGNNQWSDYLESEIETAAGQGFDVLEKGITLTVKKNGRILRRATGQPPFPDLIGTMEVMDGSRFGMPGDSERYGGP